MLYVMSCYSAKDDAMVTKVTAAYYSKDHVRSRVPFYLLYFNASTGDVVAVSTKPNRLAYYYYYYYYYFLLLVLSVL